MSTISEGPLLQLPDRNAPESLSKHTSIRRITSTKVNSFDLSREYDHNRVSLIKEKEERHSERARLHRIEQERLEISSEVKHSIDDFENRLRALRPNKNF